jgi:dTDP-L-rhamnose 4-epimerase
VLVTGGCGFVGSHIVEALSERSMSVRVIDVDIRHAVPGVEYVRGDLTDPVIAEEAVAGVDAVSHQAAMVGLGRDFRDARAYSHHNVLATASLLGALHDAAFAGRLVLASSMVVYGEGRYRCVQHGEVRPGPRHDSRLAAHQFELPCPRCDRPLEPVRITEDASTDPRSVYAATKLAQEHLCESYAREHDTCTVTSLRYHNVFGPRMPRDTPYAGVASIFMSALERREPPRVFEDGGQCRDFVHVRDVARANCLAICAEDAYGGPLNIATGSVRTVLDMANALADATGGPRPVVTGEWRAGDVRHVLASPERAESTIGFRAEIDLEQGIRELVRADGVPE